MSSPRACSACPWRLSNRGQPHPHGFYDPSNLRRLWAGLRSAEAPGMTCHPTDPRMVEFEGYENTAGRAQECIGGLILVVREVMRFQAITLEAEREGAKDGLRRYRRAHPKGLTKDGLAHVVSRLAFGGTPFAMELRIMSDTVNDPGVGYAPLGDWDPATLERARRT